MADKFCGKFSMVSSENFDKYLEKLGVGMLIRKVMDSTKPDLDISINGDTWTMKTISAVKTFEISFQLDKEFEETTPDGRKVLCLFTLNGNKLVQQQKGVGASDKSSTITREINGDELIVTFVVDGVEAKRVFKRSN